MLSTPNTIQTEDVKKAQRELLDLLEVALAGSPSWPIIRAKVLEIFGRKGLQRGGL